ncbi:alpha/beta fold hydrolase [Nocardioides dilutus]
MRSRSLDVGHRVMLREWGEGRGLVFAVHALGPVSSGALFGCAVGPLVEAGWRIAAPDLPGFGESPAVAPEDYDLTRLADLMWQVVDEAGPAPVALVGHSVGGAVALRMHGLRPDDVSALVLIDSGHLDYGEVHADRLERTLEDWLAEAPEALSVADRGALAKVLEIADSDPLMDDLMVAMVEDGDRLVSRTDPMAGAAARFALVQSRCSDDWPSVAASGTPTLLLLATEPGETRRQNEAWGARFAAAVPQADVRLVEGATHSLVTDLRAELGRILAGWLPGDS